jgi:hypothetical protein
MEKPSWLPTHKNESREEKQKQIVQCTNCKYYRKENFFRMSDECHHPENTKIVYEYNKTVKCREWTPWQKNRDCHCNWWTDKKVNPNAVYEKIGCLSHPEPEDVKVIK